MQKNAITPTFRITSSIIDDHINAEKLIAEFQSLKVKNEPAAKKLFLKIKEELMVHMTKEEEVLFPLFESRTQIQGSGPTVTMRNEHKQISALLNKMEKTLRNPKRNARQEAVMEKELLKLLKMHEEKEEEVFYPWLDKMLPEQEKKTAVAQMRN